MKGFILKVLRKAVGYDQLKKELKKEEDKNAEYRKYIKEIKTTAERHAEMNAYSENTKEGKEKNYLRGLNRIIDFTRTIELKECIDNGDSFEGKIIDTDNLIEDFLSVS